MAVVEDGTVAVMVDGTVVVMVDDTVVVVVDDTVVVVDSTVAVVELVGSTEALEVVLLGHNRYILGNSEVEEEAVRIVVWVAEEVVWEERVQACRCTFLDSQVHLKEVVGMLHQALYHRSKLDWALLGLSGEHWPGDQVVALVGQADALVDPFGKHWPVEEEHLAGDQAEA